MTLRTRLKITAMLIAVVPLGSAYAHHSFAMFDKTKKVTLQGTVKELQWTNPHSWIQLIAKDPKTGREIEYSVELGSPNVLSRQGWSRNVAKTGDKAQIVVHPLKDGTPGGSLVSLRVNGTKIGNE